jgi:hypothetical protein
LQIWNSFTRPSCRGVQVTFTVHLGLEVGDFEVTGRGSAEQVLALAASSAGACCTELVLSPGRPVREPGCDHSFERAARLFSGSSQRRGGARRAVLQQRHEG